MVQPLKLDF